MNSYLKFLSRNKIFSDQQRQYWGRRLCHRFADAQNLIPVEVKSKDGATASLNHLIDWPSFPDISYGVKFYTFPFFLAFLLKRFLKEAGHPMQ